VEATGAPTGGAQLEPLPELMRRTSGSNAEGSMAVGVERPPHRHGHPTPAAATPHEDQQHVSSLTDCPAGPRQPTCSRHTHQRPQGRETQRAECGGQPLKGTGELRAVTVAGGSACSRTARADAPTSAQACGPRVGGGANAVPNAYSPAAATPREDRQHVSRLANSSSGPRQPTCSRHTHQRPQGRETQRAECGGQPLKGTGELRAVTVAGGSACSRTARADAPTSAQACRPRVGGGSQRRAQRVLTSGGNATRGPTACLPAGG